MSFTRIQIMLILFATKKIALNIIWNKMECKKRIGIKRSSFLNNANGRNIASSKIRIVRQTSTHRLSSHATMLSPLFRLLDMETIFRFLSMRWSWVSSLCLLVLFSFHKSWVLSLKSFRIMIQEWVTMTKVLNSTIGWHYLQDSAIDH